MANTRLNKTMIVSLTLSAFAAMIVLSVLMLMQLRQRDPKYFVEFAQHYQADGDWNLAAVFYKKAWERSNDAAHLVAHGEMMLNAGEVPIALASWNAALVHDPLLTDAHMRRLDMLVELARLYGKLGDWKLVREAADTFLDSGAERTREQTALAKNAKGMALVSLSRSGEGNMIEGAALLQQAVELAPDHVEYALDGVNLLVRQGDLDQADRAFRALLQQFSEPGADASRLRLAYARFLASHRGLHEAEPYVHESVAMAREAPEALREAELGYALFLSQQWAQALRDGAEADEAQTRFDEAEAILKRRVEEDPDDYDPYLNLAVLYKSAGRAGDVINICAERLGRGLNRKGIEGLRNRLNSFSLMIYASDACVSQALAAHKVVDHDARDQWLQRAERYVADARGEFPSHPRAISQSGRVKLAKGLDRAALEDLRAAEDAFRTYDTVDMENTLTLARLHLKLNEPGAAQRVLEAALDNARADRSGDSRFWTLFAQVLFQNDEIDRAAAISDQVLQFDADNEAAQRIKAAWLERRGQRDAAGVLYEQATGDRTVRAILTAREHMLENDVEAGLAVLRAALGEQPGDVRLVSALVRELLALDRRDEARAVLAGAQKARPDDPKLQTLTVFLRDDLTADERDRAVLEIINAEKDEYQRALELLVFHLRNRALEPALQRLDEAVEHLINRDTSVAQNATIAQLRALLKLKMTIGGSLANAETLAAARDLAAQYNVDGAGGKSLLGLYHMHRQEYELAIRAFREAVIAQPTDARTWTRLGQCLQTVRQPDAARDAYERAVQANPSEGDAHWGLAMLARARADQKTYESELSLCERLIPGNERVQAALLERTEEADPQAAIARREQALANAPDDAANVRRLAELCDAVGDRDRAVHFYTRLTELQPDDQQVIVTVTDYLRRIGRPEQSLFLATRYADTRPAPEEKADAAIVLAAHYLDQDDTAAVERTLLSAADTAITLPLARAIGQFYLRRLDRPKAALPWFDRAVILARESGSAQLPGLLGERVACVLHRRFDDLDAARHLTDDLLAEFPDDPQGLLLDSAVYARRGALKEAVDSLNEYLRHRPDDAFALYQRALHYHAQGRIAEAIEDLESLKRSHPTALDLAPRLLLALLRRNAGRIDLWIGELESLVKDAPESYAALEALVASYVSEGRLQDAERVVTAQINREPSAPDARLLFLRGRVFQRRGDVQKALAEFQRGAEMEGYSAGSVITVVDAYLQLDRAADGLAFFERRAPMNAPTPELLSRQGLLLARAGRADESTEPFRRAMRLAADGSRADIRRVTADLRAAFSTPEAIRLFEQRTPQPQLAGANDRILVRLYSAAGRFDDAADKLEKLLASSTDDRQRAGLLQELGEVAQVAGRVDRARHAYEEALQYDPRDWMTLNNLAYLLSDEFGENERARPYAEQAVALVESANTLDTLGWIYVGLGEHDKAVAELSQAIRLDPSAALSYLHLGEAHRRNGQVSEAVEVLQTGIEVSQAAQQTDLVAKLEESLKRAREKDFAP